MPSKLRSPGSGPWSEYKRPIEFRTEPLRTPCVPALARVRWSGHGCGPGHQMLTLTFGQWEQRGRQYLYHLPEPDLGKALLCPGSEALGSLPMALPMPTTHIPLGLYLLPHSPEAVETKLSLTTSQRAAAILAGWGIGLHQGMGRRSWKTEKICWGMVEKRDREGRNGGRAGHSGLGGGQPTDVPSPPIPATKKHLGHGGRHGGAVQVGQPV